MQLSRDDLKRAYRTMFTIRAFEERVDKEFALGNIPGLQTHLKLLMFGIVGVSLLPVVVSYVRARWLRKTGANKRNVLP